MPHEDCTLGNSIQQDVTKNAVPWSKILYEWLFFNISSPSTHAFGSKKHWLLDIDDSSNFIRSFFLKEKSDLVYIILGLIKDLKNKYNLQTQYLCSKQEGLG